MAVLRWWFTLNYEPSWLQRPPGLRFRGQGVKVESENERLTAEGKQVHTGASEELTRRSPAASPSTSRRLAGKYPIYGELRNLFELAMVGGLDPRRGRRGQGRLAPDLLRRPASLPGGTGRAPKEVDSVVNCRVINRKTIVAGVSGGVTVQPVVLVRRQH